MTAAEFCAAIKDLGYTQASFARLIAQMDKTRKPEAIARNIRRYANGEARVSGEMTIILGYMRDRS